VQHGAVDDDLLSIGTLARLSRLSVKALRLYDAQGLLPPARVDAATGRRRYRRDQVRAAASIALLRSLDVPLATIADVLAAGGDPERLRALLGAERERSARALERRRRSLDALERLMGAGELMPYEVVLADEPPRELAGLTRAVDAEHIVDDVGAMAAALARRAARDGWAARGPWCGLYPLDLGERPAVTLAAPAAAGAGLGGGIEAVRLVGGPAVCTRHVGAYEELPLAYGALLAWAHERGHELAGPVRETYLSDPVRVPAAQRVTRVSVPLAREAP
jgi:DNA-binding transcriptional MerR regulator